MRPRLVWDGQTEQRRWLEGLPEDRLVLGELIPGPALYRGRALSIELLDDIDGDIRRVRRAVHDNEFPEEYWKLVIALGHLELFRREAEDQLKAFRATAS
jgi:hypothetical protein